MKLAKLLFPTKKRWRANDDGYGLRSYHNVLLIKLYENQRSNVGYGYAWSTHAVASGLVACNISYHSKVANSVH